MAKQAGVIKILGTIDDITFYKMGGIYYARMKSSLTGKRFWQDKAFEGSRRSAIALGKASKLASRLYRTMPKEDKSRALFCKLTGEIKLLIKTEHNEEEIMIWFLMTYHDMEMHMPVHSNSKPIAYQIPYSQFNTTLVRSISITCNKSKYRVLKE
ncbi:MAG TPA: hypothetical protein VGD33_02615 [Chitinophagaceae bacterium]